jgi:predicted Zn-dependent protease with MMP-like domain
VVHVSEERFEELVADAIDSIPAQVAQHMENVAVLVRDRGPSPSLLGLYEGIPLTARDSSYGGMVTPDRISIFREPILAICHNETEVVHQVRVTVVHEIAHHFGIDDHRLHELGWG